MDLRDLPDNISWKKLIIILLAGAGGVGIFRLIGCILAFVIMFRILHMVEQGFEDSRPARVSLQSSKCQP